MKPDPASRQVNHVPVLQRERTGHAAVIYISAVAAAEIHQPEFGVPLHLDDRVLAGNVGIVQGYRVFSAATKRARAPQLEELSVRQMEAGRGRHEASFSNPAPNATSELSGKSRPPEFHAAFIINSSTRHNDAACLVCTN
jgi:hypothetical protein